MTPTQNDLVLDLLRQRGAAGVTPMDAIYKLGCTRLAARVYDLRRAGHAISRTTAVRGRKHWAVYRLEAPR